MSLESSLDRVTKLLKLYQVKFKCLNTHLHEEQIICYFHESDQEGMYLNSYFVLPLNGESFSALGVK